MATFFLLTILFSPTIVTLSMQYIGLSVAFSFMVLLDLVGNTLVILVFFLNKSMRTAMNRLVLNLAIADMVVAIFVAIQFVIGPMYEHIPGTTGKLLCKFITGGTLAWTAALVSVCNLVAISVERWVWLHNREMCGTQTTICLSFVRLLNLFSHNS